MPKKAVIADKRVREEAALQSCAMAQDYTPMLIKSSKMLTVVFISRNIEQCDQLEQVIV
jgi:hypothetical protein